MKIVILDGSAANPGDITWGRLEDLGEVTAYDTTTKDQLLERMQGAECAITNKAVFDKDVFDKLPDLKYIGVLATGYNVVDLEAARRVATKVRYTDFACRDEFEYNKSTLTIKEVIFKSVENVTEGGKEQLC